MTEPHETLEQAAWMMTRAACLLVLARMWEIEEQLLDPADRWQALRIALERFSKTERPS